MCGALEVLDESEAPAVVGAHLDHSIYASLLDLTAKTKKELAEHEPQDGIDVQSFIWVIGKYTADDVEGRLGRRGGELRPCQLLAGRRDALRGGASLRQEAGY